MMIEITKKQAELEIRQAITKARTEEILNDAEIIKVLEKIINNLKAQA